MKVEIISIYPERGAHFVILKYEGVLYWRWIEGEMDELGVYARLRKERHPHGKLGNYNRFSPGSWYWEEYAIKRGWIPEEYL